MSQHGLGCFDSEPGTPSYALPEAQRAELAIMVGAYGAPAKPFGYGDVVSYKHGHGPLTHKARAGMVLVFWRYLDVDGAHDDRWLTNAREGEHASLSRFDCLIAHIEPSTGTLQFMPSDSHALNKEPDL